MASITDVYSGIGGTLKSTGIYLLYILPIVAFIVIIITIIRNRMIYRYNVRIFRVRENGKVKEINRKGGYIGRKNSAHFFRIKMGRFPWQYIDLTETPKIEYMDEEDRIYYKQIDIGTFVQMKRIFELNKLSYTPVESDVKYGAILSIQRIKDVLRTEPTWKKVLPYFGLILLAIVFIVAYALLMDKCS